MKKTPILISILTVLILLFSSCNDDITVAEKLDFKVYDEDIYNELLYEIQDMDMPDFTDEQEEAIQFYRENDLKVGQYVYDYYYSIIDGQPIGINQYVVLLLEDLLDINVEIVEYDFKDTNEYLKNGTVQLIPGIYEATLNDDSLAVTEPYTFDLTLIYSRNYTDIHSFEELDGKTIGMPSYLTYVVDSDVEYLKNHGINIEIKYYDSDESTVKGYDDGEIEFIISTASTFLMKEGFYGDTIEENIISKHLRFAYNPDIINEHFISAIEELFTSYRLAENMREARRAQYQYYLSKDLLFTEEEIDFIKRTRKNPIIFENITHTKPILYYNWEAGEYDGALEEVWRRISIISGLNYETRVPEDTRFSSTLAKVENGEVDGTMLKIYTPADEKYTHTAPIFESRFDLVGTSKSPALTSVTEINGYVVGAVENTTAHKHLNTIYGQENIKAVYKDIPSLIQALMDGEIDYIIIADSIYNDLYYNQKKYELTLISNFDYKGSYISVFNKEDKDNELAVSIFNKTLLAIDKVNIENHYLNTKVNIGLVLSELEYRNFIIYCATSIALVSIVLLLIQSIRKQKISNEISKTDALTKTKNRYGLYLDYKVKFSKNDILFYVDIDKFKFINETYGHSAGDIVLKEYVKKIRNIEDAKIYRFAGDEFIVICEKNKLFGKDLNQTIDMLSFTHINDEVSKLDYHIQASVGVIDLSTLEDKHLNVSNVLALADFTMYLAKKDLKANYKICNSDIIEKQKIMHSVEEKIQKDLGEVGVLAYYQPVFDIYHDKIVGFETLARWKSDGNFIYPDAFVPVLEKQGKIHKLDLFIFEEALKKMEQMIKDGVISDDVYMTSNFSPLTLAVITIDDIINIFDRYNVPKSCVVIEITESLFADLKAIELVLTLKQKGFKVAIDDFSAGHSSLNALVKMNMDFTKIDRELIEQGKTLQELMESKSTIVLKNIFKLINQLQSDIIVEGVEDYHTVEALKEIGTVRKVQGYYFSRPIDADSLEKLIIQKNH